MSDRLSVLLLCDDVRWHANTVRDHISAFRRWSRHQIHTLNPCGASDCLSLDLDAFDVVVVHYSVFVTSDHHLSQDRHLSLEFRRKLAAYRGLKVQFIQDEYRRVDDFAARMRELGIGMLFTVMRPEEHAVVWSEARLPGVIKRETLTGYVPDELSDRGTPPLEMRTIDIGYRGRAVPWWLGDLGQEKVRIGQGVLARAEAHGLRCDIAWTEDSRLYGENWIRFVSSCKAVLGTESGASITDFDGSLERRVTDYRAEHPDADYDEVHREILAPFEGKAPVTGISPRMFEAAALRTAMVLFRGHYSGILKPGWHYIALEKDFSNFDEVAGKLRDRSFLDQLIDRAHTDLVQSGRYAYATFIREFDAALEAHAACHRSRVAHIRLARAEIRVRSIGKSLAASYRSAVLLLRLAVQSPELRAVVVAGLGDRSLRSAAYVTTLFVDALRLGVLSRSAQEGGVLEVAFDAEDGRLRFISRPPSAGPVPSGRHPLEAGLLLDLQRAANAGGLSSITWTNAGLRDWLRSRGRSTAGMTSAGTVRFVALERLAAVAPEKLWAILRPLLGRATSAP